MPALLRLLFLVLPLAASAGPKLDTEAFGKRLGGWSEKDGEACSYTISGSRYRTWKPHITPTLDGGIYLSVRIDHLRGRFASDDHASLELTYTGDGEIATARSTIALQGRKVTSDLIRGGSAAGTSLLGMDRAMKVGTDLMADVSAKLLRENISEPGRVGFPAALQHNYNLLTLSMQTETPKTSTEETGGPPDTTEAPVAVPVDEDKGDHPAEKEPVEQMETSEEFPPADKSQPADEKQPTDKEAPETETETKQKPAKVPPLEIQESDPAKERAQR